MATRMPWPEEDDMTEEEAALNDQGSEAVCTEEMGPPIFDLGKCKKKAIKKLRQGRGPLMADVANTLDAIRACSAEEGREVELVPVVFVCKQKRKRRGWMDYF